MRDNSIQGGPMPSGIPRPVELAVALIGLAIISPLILLAAAAIVLTSKGPVIFRQKRVGRDGGPFVLYKLRTMQSSNPGPLVTAGGDARVTSVGRLLRKTKVDELPELWNVLKGDMSLVGPRPEIPEYVDLENETWRLVLEARPGITDPITMRLRNEETLLANVKADRERFYLETLQPFKLIGYLEYLRARTWRTDLNVLWKTVVIIALPRLAPPPMAKEIGPASKGGNL
jgi:lipopolysaccharide/colanic/teichoic acid biosynthesis glycosyltransferase